MRERIRSLHYSLQTEKAYVYWAKAFVFWTARCQGGFRHPRYMGQAEVEGFLTMLATEKQVSPANHDRATGRGGVYVPHALERKYPGAGETAVPSMRDWPQQAVSAHPVGQHPASPGQNTVQGRPATNFHQK